MEETKQTQTITKADLVESVYRKVGFSKKGITRFGGNSF